MPGDRGYLAVRGHSALQKKRKRGTALSSSEDRIDRRHKVALSAEMMVAKLY